MKFCEFQVTPHYVSRKPDTEKSKKKKEEEKSHHFNWSFFFSTFAFAYALNIPNLCLFKSIVGLFAFKHFEVIRRLNCLQTKFREKHGG